MYDGHLCDRHLGATLFYWFGQGVECCLNDLGHADGFEFLNRIVIAGQCQEVLHLLGHLADTTANLGGVVDGLVVATWLSAVRNQDFGVDRNSTQRRYQFVGRDIGELLELTIRQFELIARAAQLALMFSQLHADLVEAGSLDLSIETVFDQSTSGFERRCVEVVESA